MNSDWLLIATLLPLPGSVGIVSPRHRDGEWNESSHRLHHLQALTEAAGIPLAVEVALANRHDMKLVAATLAGKVYPQLQNDPLSCLIAGIYD